MLTEQEGHLKVEKAERSRSRGNKGSEQSLETPMPSHSVECLWLRRLLRLLLFPPPKPAQEGGGGACRDWACLGRRLSRIPLHSSAQLPRSDKSIRHTTAGCAVGRLDPAAAAAAGRGGAGRVLLTRGGGGGAVGARAGGTHCFSCASIWLEREQVMPPPSSRFRAVITPSSTTAEKLCGGGGHWGGSGRVLGGKGQVV